MNLREHGILKDAKGYLEEDMWVYGGLLLLNLTWDTLLNLAIAVNWYNPVHLPQGHPYAFGAVQIIGALFCAVQLFRKWNTWRYH